MATTNLGVLLGADIDFTTNYGDIAFTRSGDMQLLAGAALLQQRLYRRLVTNPGELLFYPDFGAGLVSYLHMPWTPAAQAQVEQLVAQQALLDPAVSSVVSVNAWMPDVKTLRIDLSITVADDQQPIVFALPIVSQAASATKPAIPAMVQPPLQIRPSLYDGPAVYDSTAAYD